MKTAAPRLALATSLALCLGLSTTAPAGAHHVTAQPVTDACPPGQVSVGRFSDVPLDSPFELAISCLADYGITRGVTATEYDASGTVARQQMAQFLYRLGTRADIAWDTRDAGYRDIGGLSPEARTAVNALTNAGIAQGRSAEVFDPAGAVTRGQMASFLARLADAAGLSGFTSERDHFDDDEQVIHEQAINRVAAAGVTAGRGLDRFFDPQSFVTRQQMAAFLGRTLSLAVTQGQAAGGWAGTVDPARVELDQSGQVVEPGDALTGQILGGGIASASASSRCTGDVPLEDRSADDGLQFSVATIPDTKVGPCAVQFHVRHGNGRTQVLLDEVVVPGYSPAPELVHAETVATSTDAGYDTAEVRFVFDDPGAYADEPGKFHLAPFAGIGQYAVASARQESPHTVVVTFGTAEHPVGPAELSLVSYASASEGALTGGDLPDGGGGPSLAGAAALHPGTTSADVLVGPLYGADLLSVSDRRPDPDAADRFLVDFLFDLPLRILEYPESQHYRFDVVLVDGTGRHCYTRDERTRRMTLSCDGTRADGPGGEIARGVVSIEPQGGQGGVPQTSSLLTRRPTAAPDVVSATWGPGEGQVTLAFDEPVHTPRGERTTVREPNTSGYSYEHPRAEISPSDPTKLVLTLPEGRADKHNHVQVRGGAVTSRRTGLGNVFEQLPLPSRISTAVPTGQAAGSGNLLGVSVDDRGVALFRTETFHYPDETNGYRIYATLFLYLRDGRGVYCDNPSYPPREGERRGYSAPSKDLQCGAFSYADSPREAPVQATPEQVSTAIYGSGAQSVGMVVVDGARR